DPEPGVRELMPQDPDERRPEERPPERLALRNGGHEHHQRRTEADERPDADEDEDGVGAAEPGNGELLRERALAPTDPVASEARETPLDGARARSRAHRRLGLRNLAGNEASHPSLDRGLRGGGVVH